MANIVKLEFAALDVSGDNFCAWILDIETHLTAKGLKNTIVQGNKESEAAKANALIFIRRHLDDSLKSEYLTVKDPQELWKNLGDRYGQQKIVLLPMLRHQWIHLRLQDFPTVRAYNSRVHSITTRLKLYGEPIPDNEMLEKTYSTFHASNVLLQQQYRARGFTKYNDLISCLMVAEQNNDLLMANHEKRPTGSKPLPETHVVENHSNNYGRGQGRGRSYSRGNQRGRGRGYGRNNVWHRNGSQAPEFTRRENNGKNIPQQKKMSNESKCHKCGRKGHWARDCYSSQRSVDRYQAFLQNNGKGKRVETNLIEHPVPENNTYLEYTDFLGDTQYGGEPSNRSA